MPDFVDPYFDETIGDLRNLLGAKSPQDLKELEAQIVFANELELEAAVIDRTNDLAELLALHKHLFGNVYDWAGKIRTVDIKKNEDNAEYFLLVSKITDAANFVFSELKKENNLTGLPTEAFVDRLAYFMTS